MLPASISSITFVNPEARHVDLKTEAEKHYMVEMVDFHAIASAARTVHDLVE